MISQPRETILITGSSGMIGSALLHRLVEQYNILAADIADPADPLPEGAVFIRMDLTSDQHVSDAVTEIRRNHTSRLASVIHLAAYYDFAGEPSDKYDTITVQGTGRLLGELRQLDVEQFIFTSTMLVHAPCKVGDTIDEQSPLQPKWDYPRSKVQTERLIKRERGEIPAVLLRIAGVYDDQCHSIPLSHQMQRIYERRMTSKVYPGDMRAGQAMVHLDDLVDAVVAAIDRRRDLPPVTTLLIGEEQAMSYDQLQREFADLIHGETWQTQRIPKTVARTGAWVQEHSPVGEDPFIKPWMIDLADDNYELDISQARHLLDWQPRHSLHDSLPAMVHSLKSDPLGWYREHNIEPPSWLERAATQAQQ